MTAGALELSLFDVALAGVLVLSAGVLSLALRFGVERSLAIAATRTVVQLLVVGYVLEWVFAVDHPFVLAGILLVMVAVASRAAVGRASRTFAGANALAFVTLVASGTLTTFTVTEAVVGVTPWYRPQYVIPLFGMVLGNSLNGISLCLDTLLETLGSHRERVELALTLGATRWEACRDAVRHAVQRGMIPILNAMTVAGIVSIPGMMTGQILAGASPIDAVKYQIVVMFMVSTATLLGCVSVGWLTYLRLTNARHQLESHLITERSGGRPRGLGRRRT